MLDRSSDACLVASEERGARWLHQQLQREWTERRGEEPAGGAWELLAGTADEVAAALDRAGADAGAEGGAGSVVVYGAAWRCSDPRQPADLKDARTVLEAAASSGARLVVLSSTEVYPPDHHHPGFVTEDQLRGRTGGDRWCEGWLALEALATTVATEAGVALTVVRCSPTPVPGGRDFWSRLLSRRLVLTLPGFDPSIQLLAIEDLARAIVLASTSEPKASGAIATYNVVPSNTVPVHKAVRLARAHRLAVPRWLQRLARSGSSFTRRTAAPERTDLLRHPWTASGQRARRDLGFEALVSSAEVAARLGATPDRSASDPTTDLSATRGVDPSWEWGHEGLDRFGMDRAYIQFYSRLLFRWVHDLYWRVEVRGLEHVPREGPGVLTGVHRGFMPYDGVMALYLLVRERGRYPRFLTHPTLVKFPILANFMTKLGGIPANQENADWVLEQGGLVGIFPEGIRGAFTLYRNAYRVGKMGRDEYVKMALRHQVPILPFVTVGSAEIFPILARFDWGWWKRFSEWPYFPIAPPFPLLPIPLPSRWHTRFLEPIDVAREHGPEAAEDPAVVQAISGDVRRRLEEAMAAMLARRRWIFFGSVFDERAQPNASSHNGT